MTVTSVHIDMSEIAPTGFAPEGEETIDWDATNERFYAMLRVQLIEWYPEADIRIHVVVGESDTRVIVVTNDEPYGNEEEEMDVRNLIGTIYGNGEFYVERS